MDNIKQAAEKILSLKSLLLYREKQMVKKGEIKPVLESVRKGTRILISFSWVSIFAAIAIYGYSAGLTAYVPSVFDYLQIAILIIFFSLVFYKLRGVRLVLNKTEEILENSK